MKIFWISRVTLLIKYSINMLFLISIFSIANANNEDKNTFSDWQKVCDEKTKLCSIIAFGYDPSGEKKARVSLSLNPSKGTEKIAEMTILSPLYSNLRHGMITMIQDNKPVRHDYDLCAKEGCINFIPLKEGDIETLKKEWNMVLVFRDIRQPNNNIVLDVSLVGFQKALKALTQ